MQEVGYEPWPFYLPALLSRACLYKEAPNPLKPGFQHFNLSICVIHCHSQREHFLGLFLLFQLHNEFTWGGPLSSTADTLQLSGPLNCGEETGPTFGLRRQGTRPRRPAQEGLGCAVLLWST